MYFPIMLFIIALLQIVEVQSEDKFYVLFDPVTGANFKLELTRLEEGNDSQWIVEISRFQNAIYKDLKRANAQRDTSVVFTLNALSKDGAKCVVDLTCAGEYKTPDGNNCLTLKTTQSPPIRGTRLRDLDLIMQEFDPYGELVQSFVVRTVKNQNHKYSLSIATIQNWENNYFVITADGVFVQVSPGEQMEGRIIFTKIYKYNYNKITGGFFLRNTDLRENSPRSIVRQSKDSSYAMVNRVFLDYELFKKEILDPDKRRVNCYCTETWQLLYSLFVTYDKTTETYTIETKLTRNGDNNLFVTGDPPENFVDDRWMALDRDSGYKEYSLLRLLDIKALMYIRTSNGELKHIDLPVRAGTTGTEASICTKLMHVSSVSFSEYKFENYNQQYMAYVDYKSKQLKVLLERELDGAIACGDTSTVYFRYVSTIDNKPNLTSNFFFLLLYSQQQFRVVYRLLVQKSSEMIMNGYIKFIATEKSLAMEVATAKYSEFEFYYTTCQQLHVNVANRTLVTFGSFVNGVFTMKQKESAISSTASAVPKKVIEPAKASVQPKEYVHGTNQYSDSDYVLHVYYKLVPFDPLRCMNELLLTKTQVSNKLALQTYTVEKTQLQKLDFKYFRYHGLLLSQGNEPFSNWIELDCISANGQTEFYALQSFYPTMLHECGKFGESKYIISKDVKWVVEVGSGGNDIRVYYCNLDQAYVRHKLERYKFNAVGYNYSIVEDVSKAGYSNKRQRFRETQLPVEYMPLKKNMKFLYIYKVIGVSKRFHITCIAMLLDKSKLSYTIEEDSLAAWDSRLTEEGPEYRYIMTSNVKPPFYIDKNKDNVEYVVHLDNHEKRKDFVNKKGKIPNDELRILNTP